MPLAESRERTTQLWSHTKLKPQKPKGPNLLAGQKGAQDRKALGEAKLQETEMEACSGWEDSVWQPH